jgi:hypothetical protein
MATVEEQLVWLSVHGAFDLFPKDGAWFGTFGAI